MLKRNLRLPTPNRMQKLPALNVILFLLTWAALPPAHALKLDRRFSAEQVEVIKSDLQVLYQLPPIESTPLHYELFNGDSSGATYQTFIESRVALILYDASESVCGPYMKACASSRKNPDSKSPIWLTPYYFRKEIPQAERLAVLIHETAHVDLPGHPSLCYGTYACDNSLHSARGTEFIFIFHMLKRQTEPDQKAIWDYELAKCSAGFRGDVLPSIRQLLQQSQTSEKILNESLASAK